jgi:hypothetical protein
VKTPSRNIAQSLRRQRVGGRGVEQVEVDEVVGRVKQPSIVAPGGGKVEAPPGGVDSTSSRSAATFGDIMQRRFGGN